MKRILMQKPKIFFCALCLFFSNPGLAAEAEFIWAEEATGSSRINVSHYRDGEWQAPQTIVFDASLNILPSMTATQHGRIAVWSTVNGERIDLRYSEYRDAQWKTPKVISTGQQTNLAPVLIHDAKFTPWLFWAANSDGEYDDIYHSTFEQGEWQTAQRVHEENTFSDVLPQVEVNANGDIVVRWQQLQGTEYVERKQIMTKSATKRFAAKGVLNRTQATSQAVITPPAFFKSRSRASLFVPSDTPRSKQIQGNLQ